MALTLTEIAVMPSTGGKRMAIWKVTGDSTRSTSINVRDLKMAKVTAAFTVNLNADMHKQVDVGTQDYVDGPVTTMHIGDPDIEQDGIENGKEHLLFVIGY